MHWRCAARSTCPHLCIPCFRPLLISSRRVGAVCLGAVCLGAMAMPGSSSDVRLTPASHMRQFAGAPWVQETKRRMPRHQEDDAEEEWFLSKTVPSALRWAAAERTMLQRRDEGSMMKMEDALEKIRVDLSTSRVAWYPQKWTTMVEGRPVQVQLCSLP